MLGNCIIGLDINRGIDKPKNLSFNNIKCEINNRLFSSSTKGFSFNFSYDSLYDFLNGSSHDIKSKHVVKCFHN